MRPEAPEELAAVVRRMMAKSPTKRYQTPLEVVQALNPFVKQGGTPKPSPELSLGAAKPAVQRVLRVDPPPAPAASAPRPQPEPANVWESLTEDSSVSIAPPKSGAVHQPRTATVRQRTVPKKWLIPGGAGVCVLLLTLLGMWAGGVLKVKTPEGTIVLENLPDDAEVTVDGAIVTLKAGDGKSIVITTGKKHQLQVKKAGFKVFGQEVEIEAGERRPIVVRLQRETVRAKPGMADKDRAKRPAIQPTFREDFDRTQVVKDTAEVKFGSANGVWYVESHFPGNGQGALNFHNYTDGIVEVRARVVNGFFGAWMVHFENREHKHGVRILVSGDGQLWILPSMFDPNPEAGPQEVRVRHSAIKPAGEWNNLQLVINGRTLGVYVNGKRVCEPITTSFLIAPGVMALGNTNEKRNVRVEFDHYILWPTTDLKDLPAD